MIWLLLVAQFVYPSDAIVDSLIRDFYEHSWFAERYDVDYVKFVQVINVSSYGRYQYECEPDKYLMGVAYTVTVGFITTEGFYFNHKQNCFLFYEAEGKWYIEQVPFLPLVDPRASPNRDKGKKI